jgi:hypothetical protein
MNQETNSDTQDTQQEKSTQSKRSSRAGRNRPVLVSSSSNGQPTTDQPVEESSDTTQPVEEVASSTVVADARPRRLPKFFSSIGKNEKEGTVEADPAAARIARATRSTGGSSATSHTVKESKTAESKSNANKASTSVANPKAAPTRATQQQSGFKSRYLVGFGAYFLFAMLVGPRVQVFFLANHWETTLFQIGSFSVTTSAVAVLLLILLLLIVLVRFDLLPRNLGGMFGQSSTQRGKPVQSQKASGSDSDKNPSPTMKQGVKGADDDLYQEYRDQQRYLQRRDRKK